MKLIPAFLFLLAAPVAQAEIFADVSTTLGDFTIELNYVNAPGTVANFIRLAEGSSPWVDQATGIVHSNKPYYDGIAYHRIIDGFMSQVGSPNGEGNDGPGYMFRDEVDNGLEHTGAHVVSMANSGPNTNGSQIFITAAAQPGLDGKHTVFGAVTSGQAVCDAINVVDTDANDKPLTPVVIHSVTIRRVGAEALAFDEDAQGVPTVSPQAVTVQHDSSGTELVFTQAARSLSTVYHSADLKSWSSDPVSRYLDAEASPAAMLDMSEETVGQSRYFFAPSTVHYAADAVFPDSMHGRTLVSTSSVGEFVFVFDSSGGGTWSFGGGSLSGTIADYINEPHAYGSNLVMALNGINFPYTRLRLGDDTTTPPLLEGRQTGVLSTTYAGLFNPALGTTQDLGGTFTLTR